MADLLADKNYLFTSSRLGFRTWSEADVQELHAINSDPQVMEFFPGYPDWKATEAFTKRMNDQFNQKGYCYFAVDQLEEKKFIGFIGLSEQNYPAPFTPCVDIGWRIKSSEWNNGYASEGALCCLEYAFKVLGLDELFSIAPKANVKSIHIMKKIGMTKWIVFDHPLLIENKLLRTCVAYKIACKEFQANGG